MKTKPKKPWLLLLAAIACTVISILVFAGVFLKADMRGRWIFGAVWAIMAVIWGAQYLAKAKRGSHHDEEY